MKNKKVITIIILVFLAIITRFIFFGYPSEVVFDEVYFGSFIKAYFTHQYYYDIHPPLGKLMIAGFVKVFIKNFDAEFSEIGHELDKRLITFLRFLPTLFSVFFVLLIYEFILVLGLSRKAAFLGAFLVAFENSLLVQSKFVLMDIFLIFFGFFAIYLWLVSRKQNNPKKKNILYILALVLAAFSFSIKWTGLSFLGIIALFSFFDAFREVKKKEIKAAAGKLILLIFIPFLTYLSVFAIHLSLLYKSGPGDAYMSPSFQKTLTGSKFESDSTIEPSSFWQKFIELNKAMYTYNANLKDRHPDESRWYEWPLDRKPIWFWTKNIPSVNSNKVGNIYLFGNPIVYFLAIVGIVFTFGVFLISLAERKTYFLTSLILVGYFSNLLPFIFISRATFIYHYFPSLIFGIISFVYLFEELEKKSHLKIIYPVVLISTAVVFLFISPISYGLIVPLKTGELYKHFIGFFH